MAPPLLIALSATVRTPDPKERRDRVETVVPVFLAADKIVAVTPEGHGSRIQLLDGLAWTVNEAPEVVAAAVAAAQDAAAVESRPLRERVDLGAHP